MINGPDKRIKSTALRASLYTRMNGSWMRACVGQGVAEEGRKSSTRGGTDSEL